MLRGEFTLLKHLCPDLYLNTVIEINLEMLKDHGIKGIICDLDNTIVPWDSEILSEEIITWFNMLKQADFRICLLSNSLFARVNSIAQILEIDAIPAAIKPRKTAFSKAVNMLQLSSEEIVVIGDQLFTDILGGKRFGLKTILVKPLSEKELFWTKFIRRMEKIALKKLQAKGLFSK